MSLVELSFVVFFIAGGLLIFWYLIVGIILICVTPEEVKQYAYTREHYMEVELAISSGFHLGSLIYGTGLLAAIAFPRLGRKRGLSDVRSLSPQWLIKVSLVYWLILLIILFVIFSTLLIMAFY
ncbi:MULTISPECIES: hypothetical protein [Vibrio harveyi group]|uniref:hypothetical protein n=2 Tax=Vibrionaceae TaxID=641 RepID=UPI000575FDA1|nr:MULTISPECIES: hypothetical protein [Vibrio harveyi group]PAW12234.1 hypothetical protein B6K85_03560 [Vibrio sp. V1B]